MSIVESITDDSISMIHFFDTNFNYGDECIFPSSYWSEEMVMLVDDPDMPIDLRVYREHKTYTERKCQGWHFFAPYHVFRLPDEDSYLIAQKRPYLLTYNIPEQRFHILENGVSIDIAHDLTTILCRLP